MNNFDENGNEEMRYMTRAMYEDTVTNELSCELILPDYLPEIRRVIYIGNTVLPPAKYVSGSNAELNGTVEYSILYVGSDGELYSAPASCEYDITVPLENASDFDLNEGVTVFATPQIENVSARVNGPRKMTVKARMKTHIRAYGKLPYAERQMGEVSAESVCKLTNRTQCAELVSALSDVITVSTEIAGANGESRISGAEAHILVEEALAGVSGISAKGSVYLKLLCTGVDGRVEQISKKLPFEGEIEAELPYGEPKLCRVGGCVSELSVNVGEDKIICDVSVMLDAQVGVNRPLRYTADLYSTEKQSACEYAEREVPTLLRTLNGNLTQSERIPLSELSIPEGAVALDAYGSVLLDTCEVSDNGKYILGGQGRYSVVCEKEGEYSVCELTVPVRYETDAADGELSCADCKGEVISCRARVGGENLELDAELSIAASFMGRERIRALRSVEFTEPAPKQSGELILCYPSPEDTVWTVAKRYSVAPENIKGEPATDTYLIIRA